MEEVRPEAGEDSPYMAGEGQMVGEEGRRFWESNDTIGWSKSTEKSRRVSHGGGS